MDKKYRTIEDMFGKKTTGKREIMTKFSSKSKCFS